MAVIQSPSNPDILQTQVSHIEDMGYPPPPSSNDSDFFEWPNKIPFSWKQIVWGATIPVLLYFIFYGVDNLPAIQYRKWIAGPIYITSVIISEITLLLYAVIVCKKHGFWPLIQHKSFSSILIILFKSFFLCLLIVIIISPMIYLLHFILNTKLDNSLFINSYSHNFNSIFTVLLLLSGFTLVPIIEELFFRGFLYNALKTKTSIFFATIIQCIIFAAIHRFKLLAIVAVFFFGIALTIVYEKRKNLLFPVFIHCIKNAMVLIPLLILALQNIHFPASTMEKAKIPPAWLLSYPSFHIKKQRNGMDQYLYAINSWGSKGTHQWKKEANAFNAVGIWFPEDRKACAEAKLGIIEIYLYRLTDYRRAIYEAEQLLANFPDKEEQCAHALTNIGIAYYQLRDFRKCRQAFETVLNRYNKVQGAVNYANRGLAALRAINEL